MAEGVLAAIRLGDEEEDYRPSMGETSSIVLLTLCVACTLSSFFVCYSVYKIGAHTASSKLIIYLTLTHTNMNFAKTPFLFNNIPYGCYISGLLFFYSYSQIYLICYFMVVCSYAHVIERSKPEELLLTETTTTYELNPTIKTIIFVVPLISLILPLSTDVFEEKFNWCGINPDSQYGFLVFMQYVVIFAIISLMIFYQTYKIFSGIPFQNLSTELFDRFFKGPFLYAATSFAIILACSIFVFTRVNGDETGQREYYHQYAIIVGMYFPGLIYVFIFLFEKSYLQSIEDDYDEMNMFSKAFYGDGDSDMSSFSLSYSMKPSVSAFDGSLNSQLLKWEE